MTVGDPTGLVYLHVGLDEINDTLFVEHVLLALH